METNLRKIFCVLCFLVATSSNCFQAHAATLVAGVPQGSSGKYNIGVATPFIIRFDVPSISNGPFTFQSFQLGLSANNGANPLTMSLQSTAGLDISQTINFSDTGIGSGNSAPNVLLSFTTAGVQALSTGTYSLVFSVTADSQWTITEAFTSFVFAEAGNLANTVTDISISNFENASDGSVSAVPESEHYVTVFGLALAGFMFFRSRKHLAQAS